MGGRKSQVTSQVIPISNTELIDIKISHYKHLISIDSVFEMGIKWRARKAQRQISTKSARVGLDTFPLLLIP